MGFRQIIEEKKQKQSYKSFVYKSVLCFVLLLLIILGTYIYWQYRRECENNAAKEAQSMAERVVSQIEERLTNLEQYYVAVSEHQALQYIIENDISYSDYSLYKAAYDEMGGQGIFSDYVSGFTFANFKTGWVLSNKGMFQLEEANNGDLLTLIYEKELSGVQKMNWFYDRNIYVEDTVNREYRITVDTSGLNIMMRLPRDSYNTHAIMVANINMESWKGWLREWLHPYESIVVLDANKNVIYAENTEMAEVCQGLELDLREQKRVKYDGVPYMIAKENSGILGWEYYILYDIYAGQANPKVPFLLGLGVAFTVVLCYVALSYLIYHPVKRLINRVSDQENQLVGNELDYFAGKYQNLKEDKQVLEKLLLYQQGRLKELFALRLIQGNVNEEEWKEYVERLELKGFTCFATVVAILDFREEEAQSVVSEDAICLQILQELPVNVRGLAWMPPVYNTSAIFTIFAEDTEDELVKKIGRFREEIQECAKSVCDFRIQLGVSATHTDYRHIRAAYRESLHALTFKAVADKSETDNCHFYLANSTVKSKKYNERYEQEIQNAIKSVDKNLCYDITGNFCKELIEGHEREEEIIIHLIGYVNAILITAVNVDVNLQEMFPDGIRKRIRELLEVVENERIRRYLKRYFIDPVMKQRMEGLERQSSSMIEQIEELIEESKGNITLTECADALGVHQTYVWKILKMHRDKSFSDYIEEYKINEAKRLLLETNKTVAEIAEELHYTNPQNFIRFFSKTTGLTPGKFRKLI